ARRCSTLKRRVRKPRFDTTWQTSFSLVEERASLGPGDDSQRHRLRQTRGRALRQSSDLLQQLLDDLIALAITGRLGEPDALDRAVEAHPRTHRHRVRAGTRALIFLQLVEDFVFQKARVPRVRAAAGREQVAPALASCETESVATGATFRI